MDLEVAWVPITGKMNKWKLMDEFFKKKIVHHLETVN